MNLLELEQIKSVAEFMELPKDGNRDYLIQDENENVKCCLVRQLKYHSSWDWLIPVVEKIESLGEYSIMLQGKYAHILDKTPNQVKILVSVEIDKTDWLKCAYNLCVEFIEWYNENK